MDVNIDKRLGELLAEGRELLARISFRQDGSPNYWPPTERMSDYHAWMMSAANLIWAVVGQASPFGRQCQKVMDDDRLAQGVPRELVQNMQGLLASFHKELEGGLVGRIEYAVAATTFDDFLDHAQDLHKSNMKNELVPIDWTVEAVR